MAAMVKSVKVNVAVVPWDAVPGEPPPLIAKLNVPDIGEVQDTVEVPVPLATVSGTLAELNGLHDKPAGTVSVRDTVPTKLNVLVRVTVDVIDDPATPVGDVALIVKSPTWETKVAV